MVGGGIQNRALCQWTANSIGRTVLAGPTEATALGNIGVQMLRSGVRSDIGEIRKLIRDSERIEEFAPQDMEAWADAYARFQDIKVRR
jgi:rhamnulokinase